MKFHNTLKPDKGFTLIEVIISISIMVVLLGVTTPFVLNFYRRYQLDSERNTLLSMLRQARTMSMAGEGSTDHGVYIASTQYTIYEGGNYGTRTTSKDQTFERDTGVAITGPNDFVFRYLTGKTASKSFSLDNETRQSNIYVNTEGTIDWQ